MRRFGRTAGPGRAIIASDHRNRSATGAGVVSPLGSPPAIPVRRHNGVMLIVCGHLVLDPSDRDAHVVASVGAVRLARQAPGCLDFAVSADPVDPTRVNVFERWADPEDRDAFRASG